MKRLVCFMVAAAMLLSLAACAPTTQPNNPENTNPGNTNDPAQPGDTTVTPADGEVSTIWFGTLALNPNPLTRR